MSDAPIRVGLLIDRMSQPGWVFELVSSISRDQDVEIAYLIVPRFKARRPARSFWEKLRSRWREIPKILAFELLLKVERRLLSREDRDYLFGSQDILELVPSAKVVEIDVEGAESGMVHRITEDSARMLKDLKLDLIIRRALNIVQGELLSCAVYGMWSFHHGDHRRFRGGPPGFWEVYYRENVSGLIIQRLSSQLDNGTIIREGSVYTEKFWLRNAVSLFKKGNLLFADALNRGVLDRLSLEPADPEPSIYTRRLFKRPGFAPLVWYLARLFGRAVKDKAARLIPSRTVWQIGFGSSKGRKITAYNSKRLVPPRGFFYADPFVFAFQGSDYLFFENFSFERSMASIAYVRLDASRIPEPPRDAIVADYHLSYPFLFEHDERAWMIPESSANRTIELWEAVSFPSGWKRHSIVMNDVLAVDTSVVSHAGKWWLLTNIDRVGNGAFDELHVFFADDPVCGPWIPHPLNPVVTNAERGRNGGLLDMKDGRLYRCAQCRGDGKYGKRLSILEIVELSTTGYRERLLGTHTSDFLLHGRGRMHHLSANDRIFAFDYAER